MTGKWLWLRPPNIFHVQLNFIKQSKDKQHLTSHSEEVNKLDQFMQRNCQHSIPIIQHMRYSTSVVLT